MSRLAVALLVVALSGCVEAGAARGRDGVEAVATVFPLAWIAEEIAPESAVTYLGTRGQDPHDLELTPQQRALVERAGVVAYLGDIGFQPSVEAAIPAAAGEVVPVTDVVDAGDLLPVPGGDAGAVDPHVWFDAGLMAPVAQRLGDAFAAADPAGAAAYRDNAARVAATLRRLDADVDAVLGDCRFDTVVVSHAAYAYLLEPHGITQEGVSGPGGHAGASPQRVAELAATIAQAGIPAVLSEPVEGRRDAEAVAREAGVDIIEILSLDVVDEERAARGYPDLLREQAQAAARAAGCAGAP